MMIVYCFLKRLFVKQTLIFAAMHFVVDAKQNIELGFKIFVDLTTICLVSW